MKRFARTALAAFVVSIAALSAAPPARADESLVRLRETLKREPKAPEAVKMALSYFHVSPDEVRELRASARARGLLPVVSAFGGYYSGGNASAQTTTITTPTNVVLNGAESSANITGGLAWDLRELVFNSAEVQTFAAVPMQRDIMLEVVRTYYLRRQLQIRLALKPPADPLALATVELRVEEYTALLNSMTGGAFLRAATTPAAPAQ